MRKIIVISIFLCVFLLPAAILDARDILVRVNSLSGEQFDPYSGGKSTLSFSILGDADVTIRLFDLKNFMVLEKKLSMLKDGQYKFNWDGKDGKGKTVAQGFYKYELSAKTADNLKSDNDYTIVEVRKGRGIISQERVVGDELPPAVSSISEAAQAQAFTMEIKGRIRSTTAANTAGVNWNREEIYLNLKGDYGQKWIYDFTFFPSYSMNQPFQWNNFVYNALFGYRDSWGSIEGGYRNYLEGYYDPLNLLADYQMGSDRVSAMTKLNIIDNLTIGAGVHRLIDLNQTGVDVRATYDLFNILNLGGSVVTNIYPLYRNTVLATDIKFDFNSFTPINGTFLAFEIAKNVGATKLDDTHPEIPFGGTAMRFEAQHGMFYIPQKFGDLAIKFAAQNITSQFVADFGDIPNGVDSVGTEIGGDYSLNLGLPALKSLRTETKGSFFTNIAKTTATKEFRQNVSTRFTDGLSFMTQYEYLGRDNISIIDTTTLQRQHNVYGELRYYKPETKPEVLLRSMFSSDTTVTSSSLTEYVSTYFMFKYHFAPVFSPYIAYERTVRSYGANNASNQNYHYIMPGFELTIFPKTRTELGIQAGYVINNMAANAFTYYAKLGHYFTENLNALLTVGSQTSIDPSFRIYGEIKYEF